jgi:hypothetical protein
MGDEELIFNNGSTLEMGDLAKKYEEVCRGSYYFFRGFAVYVPASLGTDGKYTDVNGKTYDAVKVMAMTAGWDNIMNTSMIR